MKKSMTADVLTVGNLTKISIISSDAPTHMVQAQVQSLMHMMEPFHDHYTCPHVFSTFKKGPLQQWFANCPVCWEGRTPQQGDKIGQATLQAFLNQQDIGWNQAVRGRISRQWGISNALQYCRERKIHHDDTRDEQLTTQLVVSSLWHYGMACWRFRNQFLYSENETQQAVITMDTEVNTLVKHLYAMIEMINPHDSALFLLQAGLPKTSHSWTKAFRD